VAGALDIRQHPGLEPTNNHAERALLSAVIYRKPSLGSQSETGELRTARPLSAHTTCRLQKRSLFVDLTEAISAHARGDPVPLLRQLAHLYLAQPRADNCHGRYWLEGCETWLARASPGITCERWRTLRLPARRKTQQRRSRVRDSATRAGQAAAVE
jgi:hypothetical protein